MPPTTPSPRKYETDDKAFILCAITAGYPVRDSRLKDPSSHIVLFIFHQDDTAILPGLGEVSFIDWATAFKMGSPDLPCQDIRRLVVAMSITNFIMKEKHFENRRVN